MAEARMNGHQAREGKYFCILSLNLFFGTSRTTIRPTYLSQGAIRA